MRLNRSEIEALDYFAVGGIQEQRLIGIVAGDAADALGHPHTNAEAGRIGNVLEFRPADFSTRDFVARRQRHESLRSNASVLEGVHRDTVAGAALLLAEGIGERSHGSEKVFAVEAEGQAEEICLTGFTAETIIRKVGEFVGFEIEDGERLFLSRGIGAIAAVEEDRKAAIGRE